MDILPFVFSFAVCCALIGLPLFSLITIGWCVLMVVTRLLGADQPAIEEGDSHLWN